MTTTAPAPSPPRRSTRWTRLRLVLVAALATAAVLAGSGVAEASSSLTGGWGSFGPTYLQQGRCDHHTAWNRLDASTAPPTVYARNSRSGWGNDWAWIRYRAHLVDARGVRVSSTGFSGWSLAYDDRPATWSGTTRFAGVPDGARIDLEVEWWSSTRQLAELRFRITGYQHHRGGVGPFGVIGGCARS